MSGQAIPFAGLAFVNDGFRPVVGLKGWRWATMVCFHDGGRLALSKELSAALRVRPESDQSTAIYDPQRAARRFLRTKAPMTKGARELLQRLRGGA